jgi:GNAT superfamily N-acetyltransferase
VTEFRIAPRRYDHPDAVAVVAAIQQYYQQLYGGHDDDHTDPAQFTPPDGVFLVGYLGEAAVASGGWRRRDAVTAEIKRMYVAEEVRGRGLARRLLAELEATAAAVGVTRMVLSTGFRQFEAIAFYEASGYRRTDERFGFYAEADGAYFFAKSL